MSLAASIAVSASTKSEEGCGAGAADDGWRDVTGGAAGSWAGGAGGGVGGVTGGCGAGAEACCGAATCRGATRGSEAGDGGVRGAGRPPKLLMGGSSFGAGRDSNVIFEKRLRVYMGLRSFCLRGLVPAVVKLQAGRPSPEILHAATRRAIAQLEYDASKQGAREGFAWNSDCV